MHDYKFLLNSIIFILIIFIFVSYITYIHIYMMYSQTREANKKTTSVTLSFRSYICL